MNPTFSIITVCKNSESTIQRTISSLRKNPRRLFEFIIVDGQSTDSTRKIITANIDIVDTYICEVDKGIYDAMNKGLKHVRGDFVMFLNSDDWLEENVLLKVYDSISKNPGYDVYHGYMKIHGQNHVLTTAVGHQTLPTSMPSYQPASFVKKKSISQSIWFDSVYKIAADFKFFKQLQIQGLKFFKMNFPITNFSVGGASSNSEIRLGELRNILLELDYPRWLVWLLILRIRYMDT
ncbi:glycosyltransferase [Cylindrospermopsis raciborskii]|uniref:glycosyltransferase n=1 Tax=Cylindrospermopsis raciborskii TaxID=77022 RepID=UPI00387A3FEC